MSSVICIVVALKTSWILHAQVLAQICHKLCRCWLFGMDSVLASMVQQPPLTVQGSLVQAAEILYLQLACETHLPLNKGQLSNRPARGVGMTIFEA